MRYTIVTPTVLRSSLLKACESVNSQTSKDWQHIVVVDSEIADDLIPKIAHPQRIIVRCDRVHGNWGHTCRHNVWSLAKGDYLYYLDDDNYLADDEVLKDLEVVTADWAVFPILRLGEHFFNDPPGRLRTDTGSILVKRTLGAWPDSPEYNADGLYVEQLVKQGFAYEALPDMRPLMVMPICHGDPLPDVEVVGKIRVSIFTPVHNNAYLREAYESIKDQDFYEWVVAYNNGGVPVDFGDKRVKTHVLYSAPEKVGTLKAYACERAEGDVLLELDCDDMLAPTAIEEVQKAFSSSEVGFAYSNTVRAMGDFSKFPRFSENYGWEFRETEFRGHSLDEFVAFPPTPDAVSRVWYAPDHLRAFRRSTYKKVGGHDKAMRILDDSDLMCRMYIESRFRHIDKPLYMYRVHGQNSWLKYNQEIQDGVYSVYDKYIVRLVERWARQRGLPMVEIGGFDARLGYQVIAPKDANWPLASSSVGIIRATDIFSQLHDPLSIMKEVYRVLVPGGWLFCQVPSTDGRGAYQDPRHVSFWNENSFLYYTNRDWAKFIGTPVRFQAPRLFTTEKNVRQVCWTVAHLISLKDGYRPAGLIEI